MKLKSITFIVSSLILVSCIENEKSSSSAEDAFAKIDKKTESLFTKEDRKKSYQNSVALSEEKSNSFKKNITYNGYGASVKNNKTNNKSKSELNSSSEKKKKVNYSYRRTSSSQTYSAYSTN